MTALTLYRVDRGADYDTLQLRKTWQDDHPAAQSYRSLCATRLSEGSGALALAADGKWLDVFHLAPQGELTLGDHIALDTVYDLVRAFLVGGKPHVVCYAADNGTIDVYRLEADAGLTAVAQYRRTYGTLTTGFTTVEPYSHRGAMLLLCYNKTSGEAVIYQLQVAATQPLTVEQRWTAAWAPGWVHFALFSLGGEAFFLKSNVEHGDMVYIDHFADDPTRGSHPVGAHLPALPAAPRIAFDFDGSPLFATIEQGELNVNRIHVDCQGWHQVGRTAEGRAIEHMAVLESGGRRWLLVG